MTTVLTRDDVASLLVRQARAYELLLWLGRTSAEEPTLLDTGAARELANARTVPAWLARHRHRIPPELLPAQLDPPFAALFASFLATSFRIDHVHFGDRLVATYLVRGAAPEPAPRAGLAAVQTLALKHLLAAERIPASPSEVGSIARRPDLAEALALWTYVWELDRRSRGKGKGPLVHALWRRLPRATRHDLTTARVWDAREQLLAAGRHTADPG
jgi:hypothetical protein